MKYILLGFFAFYSLTSYAAGFIPEESFKDFKCQKELQSQLKSVFTQPPQWVRATDYDFETRTFRAPAKVGEWYELRITEKKTPSMTFLSTEKMAEYTWDKACKPVTKPGPGFEFFVQNKKEPIESFSDMELAKLLKEKKKGVLYLWSPHMVYSITEFTRLRSVIEKKGLEFIPVLDHAVDVSEAKAAMKKAGVEFKVRLGSLNREPSSVSFYKKMNSVELYMRNGNLHFPTMFVYANGKINPRRIIGVMTNEGLDQALNEWLEEIK